MSNLVIKEIPMPKSKFKINDTVKFADIGIYQNYIFKVAGVKQNDRDETFGYRYNLDNITKGTKPLRLNNIPEDNLVFAGARLEEPETASEEPQGQLPAEFDIVQLRNGEFYQKFNSVGYIKLVKDSCGNNFMVEDHYKNNELEYIDSLGSHHSNFDIMKIYRGIATDRVLTASASELKKYEVWSRIEPYVIPEKLIKAALKDFVGFEEEDIKVDEKNRFYIDGAIVGESARKFIENEEWKKKETEIENPWAF